MMMDIGAVFAGMVNRSIAAGWLILAVAVLRLLLRKAPRWINCLLWAIVAVRLVCPFSFESILSLIPSSETIPVSHIYSEDPIIRDNPYHYQVHSGVTVIDRAVTPTLTDTAGPVVRSNMQLVAALWLAGVVLMLSYASFSYLRLRRKVRASLPLRENIYLCDEIPSPFILGIVRPRIYLPSGMKKETVESVITHEHMHLRRHDHWWKPLGYLLLSVYWFQPLLWVAYILFCRDVELACDEKAVRGMEREAKAAYAQALLDCSSPRRLISACPLAFGEVGVKERVMKVLRYRKPVFWISAAALVACVVVAVCFLTDPKEDNVNPESQEVSPDTPSEENTPGTPAESSEAADSNSEDGYTYYEYYLTEEELMADLEQGFIFRLDTALQKPFAPFVSQGRWPFYVYEGNTVNLEIAFSDLLMKSHEEIFPMEEQVTVDLFSPEGQCAYHFEKKGEEITEDTSTQAQIAVTPGEWTLEIRFGYCCGETSAHLRIAAAYETPSQQDIDWLTANRLVSCQESGPTASPQEMNSENLFALIPKVFYLSEGSKKRSTVLYLREDGSFTGICNHFFASDISTQADPERYPLGTVYSFEFSGIFTQPKQVDDLTWSVRVQSLKYGEPEPETVADGIRYISEERYSIDEEDEFLIHLPGYPVADFGLSSYAYYDIMGAPEYWEEIGPANIPFFVLHHVNKDRAFYSGEQQPDTVLPPQDGSEPLFAQMPETYYFLSGAGAWQTELHLREDGSFTGTFEDADVGTLYICDFQGSFTAPVQVEELVWSTHVQSLEYEEPGRETKVGDTLYIRANPYGLDQVDEVRIYLPGYPLADLPEEAWAWVRSGRQFWNGQTMDKLPFYVLYNVNGQQAFFSESVERTAP